MQSDDLPVQITKENYKKILKNYDTVIVSLEGSVFAVDGVGVVAGAARACCFLAEKGKEVIFVTNRDSHSRKKLKEKLETIGIRNLQKESIITSGYVTTQNLAAKLPKRKKVYVACGEGVKEELEQAGIQTIGFGEDSLVVNPFLMTPKELKAVDMDPEVGVVVVGMDPWFGSGKLLKAASYVGRGAEFVATDEGQGLNLGGHVVPGTGSTIALVASTAGRRPSIMGKPSLAMWKAIKQLYPMLQPRKTLLVGDSLMEDVAFASGGHVDSLLVMNGRTSKIQVDAMLHALERNKKSEEKQKVSEMKGDPELGNITVIFIVGGPGCGKGTQCDKLKQEFKLTHISSGDLLRDEVASNSPLGKELTEIMERGELVPMDTVLTMIRNAMKEAIDNGSRGFLIDGYPREEQQGILFESKIHTCQVTIYYQASDDTMLQRMKKRAATSGRADDNEVTMIERLKTFHKHSQPVVEYYKNAGKLIEICAEDAPENVFERTVEGLKKSFMKNVQIIFIVGGPGCGKGTQCERLKEAFHLTHISSGDLLREEVESGSTKGQELKAMMDRGELVPIRTVLTMIQNAMIREVMHGSKGFLIDGYPREEEQGILFESEIHPCCACIYYKVGDDTMLQRMRKRAETSDRSDDNDETMMERLKTFHKHSEPVVHYYKKTGKLIQIYAEESAELVFGRSVDGLCKALLKQTTILFIIGGPGCGKGTQCEMLKQKYDLTHISSGDLLREEVASGSTMGQQLTEIMNRGELVPMETVLGLLQNAVVRAAMAGSKGFLIDGYPREEEQGVLFESKIHSCQACIYYKASDETMLQRMKKRAETSGRADDNQVTMKERLKTFHQHANPVVDYYKKAGKLIQISAEDLPENVFYQTCMELREKNVHPSGAEVIPPSPTFLLESLGDIGNWIYLREPKKKTPETCCCEEKTESEVALTATIHPPHPCILTIIGSHGSQRNRVCEGVAQQFGLLCLDENVLLTEEINNLDSPWCQQIRRAQDKRCIISWKLLLEILSKRMEEWRNQPQTHRGVVIGVEAREEIFKAKSERQLLDTVKLMGDSSIISYLVMPKDKYYRKHLLQHESVVQRHLNALTDTVTTPTWAKVWTNFVRVRFNSNLTKKVQTVDAMKSKRVVTREVEAHISNALLKDLIVIFVIGGPASGKKLLCERLAETYLFEIIKYENLISEEIASKSAVGRELETVQESGSSVPTDMILTMIRNAMVRAAISGRKGFLIEGYPEQESDGIFFESKIYPCEVCVYLNASEKASLQRKMKDETQTATEFEVFQRINEFRATSALITDYYKKKDKLLELRADDTPENIFHDVVKALERRAIHIPHEVARQLKVKQLEEEKQLLSMCFVIFVVGGPGAGKSTQCDRLKEAYNLSHIEVGKILRKEVESLSPLGQHVRQVMAGGAVVEDDVILGLVRTAMLRAIKHGTVGFVIDNFPIEIQQVHHFESEVVECDACLYIHVDEETMMTRSMKRGLTSGRVDDQLPTQVKKCIKNYKQGLQPILDHFRKVEKLLRVDALEDAASVFAAVVDELKHVDLLQRKS